MIAFANLNGGVSKNHHPKSVSTSLLFFVAQKFRTVGPIQPHHLLVGLTDIFA